MKSISFVVDLTFDGQIDIDKHQKEIGNNILDALVNQADTKGLSPEDAETFTREIQISYSGIVCAYLDLTDH